MDENRTRRFVRDAFETYGANSASGLVEKMVELARGSYDNGYDHGFREGRAAGFEEGEREGRAQGYASGYDDGRNK